MKKHGMEIRCLHLKKPWSWEAMAERQALDTEAKIHGKPMGKQ